MLHSKRAPRPTIPASLDRGAMEEMVRARVESFCESRTEARSEVAKEFGFAGWKELVAHLESRPVVPPPPRAKAGKPVVFDVCFSRGEAYRALRKAGLHADPFRVLTRRMSDAAQAPVEAPRGKADAVCPYLKSKYPVSAKVRVMRYGLPTDLRVEVADRVHGERLRERLTALAARDAPRVESERRHTALWGWIAGMLERNGVTVDDLYAGRATLPRAALAAVIKRSRDTPADQRGDLHSLCARVGREDREVAARWLISELERPDADDQLECRIWEVAVPAVAGDLIRLIRDRRHGRARGGLCLALAKTRDPRAARVIAGVLGQKGPRWFAIKALGVLKAKEYACAVREYLHDPDADVRAEAQKTLRKMGKPAEPPPAPVHLVKERRKLPRGLAEWSANLDIKEAAPILQKLGGCVSGFGAEERAEVLAVMEDMAPDQTRAFRFPVRYRGQVTDVWIVIFMDDVDSPDLAMHAPAGLIAELESALRDS